MKRLQFYIFVIFIFLIRNVAPKLNNQQNVVIDNINDIKELKKLLRTKTNMLVMFITNLKETQSNVKVFREAAEIIKGQGTMVLIDCSNSDKKKLCKKLKVTPEPYHLKHYKDGDFHKDYDRQMIVSSLVNFMRDPTGDLPWQEDPKGVNVLHITGVNQLTKLLKKDMKPMLIMFYAPWCGFCKQLKPEYSDAATELKGKYIMAAMDVDRPENSIARRQYNITGFPTMLYFENGKIKYTYEGENKKASLIAFMENPGTPITKPKEDDWSADTSSEIVHLTNAGFAPALKDEKSVLVMFYAPWCGHCKRMKPEYEKAAIQMKNEKIPGILAALDATKESAIGQEYDVKGYPTVKYFVNGEFKFDVNVRDAEKIVSFMKDPKEPPPPPPPEKSWDEEESEVEHLTDETFKVFLKKKKHTLVMFYAPWCGHCKKAKPEFTAAAEEFKEDPRIALAAVDCTKYSAVCSTYEVRGYPTFKYFSYLKTVIDYSGGRLSNDFISYLKKSNNDGKTINTDINNLFNDKIEQLNDNNFNGVAKNNDLLIVMFYLQNLIKDITTEHFFNQAAEKLSYTNKKIKFGAVDCTANKKLKLKYNIDNKPKFIIFRNGEMSTIYSGSSQSEIFIEYIKQYENLKDEL